MSLKTEILMILEQNRKEYISGESFAQKLDVSRAAIWKAISSLRQEGHIIGAVKNKGYMLSGSSDVLSAEAIETALKGEIEPEKIFVFKTIGSTNTEARLLADGGAQHGTLVISEQQTEGRGRRGKSFFSPSGTGIYMSIILRPDKSVSELQMITVATAVTVCKALEQLYGCQPKIKWVNDIFLNERKICGILTEAVMDMESGGLDCIVVGIGINCTTNEVDFPKELQGVAGSIGEKGMSRSALAAEIYKEILRRFNELDNPDLIKEYRSRSMMQGKMVSFLMDGEEKRAKAIDINDVGNLIVRFQDGSQKVLCGGEISVIAE